MVKWLVLLAVVLTQLLTVVLLKNTERFYVEKQQLLSDPEFVQGDAFWRQQGDGYIQHNGKTISLINDVKGNHFISQTVPIDQSGHYAVSFEAAIGNVAGATQNYGGAEVIVVYRNQQGSTNSHGKRLLLATGTRPMATYSRTLHLGGEIGSVDIAARLKNASGKLTVSNFVVSRLQELPLFKKIKYALIAVWVLVFAAFGWIALRVLSRPQATLLTGTLTVGLVGVLLPDGLMTSLNSLVETLLPAALITATGNALAGLFGFSSLAGGAEIGKMGHFAVFLLLGVIAGFNFRKIGLVFSMAVIATFAALTESLQLLVVGRTTSFIDFLIDVSGGAIGLCVGIGIYVFFGDQSSQIKVRDGAATNTTFATAKPLANNRRRYRFNTIKNLKNSLKSLRS